VKHQQSNEELGKTISEDKDADDFDYVYDDLTDSMVHNLQTQQNHVGIVAHP
jgi:hypothetical protein